MKLDENDDAQYIDFAYEYRITLVEAGGVTQLRSDGTFLDDENAPNVEGYPYIFNPYCESITTPPEE